MSQWRRFVFVLLLIAIPSRVVLAQEAPPPESADASAAEDEKKPKEPFYASPYLPLDRWEYPILDYWVSAGLIHSLSTPSISIVPSPLSVTIAYKESL
jgi:hypothetical protein